MAALLAARDIGKTYSSHGYAVPALTDVNLCLSEGDVLAVLGENGTGKSTLMHILTGRMKQDKGSLEFRGSTLVGEKQLACFRSCVGMASQENTLDRRLTIEENLQFYARYFGLERHEAASRTDVALQDLGLVDRRKAPVYTLSPGQVKQLMVERALITSPEILFLDEPTTSVDPSTREWMLGRIRTSITASCSAVLSTHNMSDVSRLASHVLVLSGGRVVAFGSIQELVDHFGGYPCVTFRGLGGSNDLLDELTSQGAISGLVRTDDLGVARLQGHSDVLGSILSKSDVSWEVSSSGIEGAVLYLIASSRASRRRESSWR